MKRLAAIIILFCVLLLPQAAVAQQAQSTPPQNSKRCRRNRLRHNRLAKRKATLTFRWVNTKAGVYHCPGTHWYGATKSGEYMKQSEAQQKDFRPAYHRTCK